MSKTANNKQVKYYLNPDGEFVIENYNFSRPLANFFPGIAGKYGIPMWVFYVNRGQAIASFGTKDKDHSILEFFPANRSWQFVTSLGFRTFIKVKTASKQLFYEPFHNGFVNRGFDIVNKMRIAAHGLGIEEVNRSLGLKIQVEYFTIPNDSFAALARIVRLENISRQPKNIQLIDGLPQIVPFGTSNLFLKKLSRTIEAWMQVENLDQGVPFYKLSVDPVDRPEVIHIHEGNFYLGFHCQDKVPHIIKPMVDPASVFGRVTDFSQPCNFLAKDKFSPPQKEIVNSKTPSALLALEFKLKAGEKKVIYNLCGYMRNLKTLNGSLRRITAPAYLEQKRRENKELLEGLTRDIFTQSSSREFDLYCRQTYLDNILRGGYPQVFKNKRAFYLFSRKHGDLERDYNKFLLEPTYYSQGNGNYRDINQNRRSDVWFNPALNDENIITFFNLLQTDGFNPLVVKGANFQLRDAPGLRAGLKDSLSLEQAEKLLVFLSKPFTPGEAILFLEDRKIKPGVTYDELLELIVSCSEKILDAEHAEGFWIDHWTYNLDLLESYLAIYPEELTALLLQKREFTFFDNSEVVRPRSEKYLLYNGLPRQLHAIAADTGKKELIKKRALDPHVVRVDYGHGGIYKTTLLNKLLCLFVNKLASLDPCGCGIEMEADKPNWFDALNGLPALFGSSLCETLELKRLILFITDALKNSGWQNVAITEEVRDFLISLSRLIRDNLASQAQDKDYLYWDAGASLKEAYRQKIKLGVSGRESEMPVAELLVILQDGLKKVEQGIVKARDKKQDIYYSYFINEVAEYDLIGEHFIRPKKFAQKKVPFFLEGQMHALRLASDSREAKKIYAATRKSGLFDRKLKMYKVTSSLNAMPEEIGRCRVFTPGWLENESIWLHMEYKYLLEALKQGLYEEFYQDFKNALIPFQNPARYGRSILENSSFLVSSAFPDKALRGAGYVARLSGSSAEFLEIWRVMNAGKRPFRINNHQQLELKISPALPGWLFTKKENGYSFNFLGAIRLTYINPRRKDTFGKNGVKPVKISFQDKDGRPVEILSDTIPAPYAGQVRSRQINKIDIYLE